MRLSPEAFELWDQLAYREPSANRGDQRYRCCERDIQQRAGFQPRENLEAGDDLRGIAVGSRTRRRDWQVIQADTLDLAARHEAYCVAANKGLDAIANRAEIQDEADAILAQIRSGKCGEPQPDGHFYLTRTQLTNQFASQIRAATVER